jgi:hypothetical protein
MYNKRFLDLFFEGAEDLFDEFDKAITDAEKEDENKKDNKMKKY